MGNFWGLFFQSLGRLCTFNFIDKIVSVQYIVQMYAEQHTGTWCELLNEHRLRLLDEETDALHKINDYIYKDIEHKYSGC